MENFVLVVFFLFNYVFAQNILSVDAFDEQSNNPSQQTLRIRVTNELSDTLRNVRLRYFLNYDSNRVLDTSIYYLPEATLSLDTLGALIAVNVNFPKLAPGITPNSSGISFGMHYMDWQDFKKSENFSYPKSNKFVQTNKISLWQDDAILYGISPSLQNESQSPIQLKLFAIRPEKHEGYRPFVEIKNIGSVVANADSISFLFSNGQRHYIREFMSTRTSLDQNEKVKIYLDSLLGEDAISGTGEILLEYASIAIDYVAWGHPGIYSVFAEELGIWKSSSDYLKTGEKGCDFAENYNKGGIYFRYNINEVSPFAWRSYSSYEEDDFDSHLPFSHSFSAPNGIKVVAEQGETLNFTWKPVLGAEEYRLTVLSEDSNLVYQSSSIMNSVNIDLPYGKYFWVVEAKNRQKPYRASIPKEAYSDVRYAPRRTDIADSAYLNIPSYRGRKDTRLLNLSWGEFADLRGWDKPHTNDLLDEDEGDRCWAIAIQELNHYYGGDLTQDELIAVVKMHIDSLDSSSNHKGPALAALGVKNSSGGSEVEVLYGLQWALNNQNISIRHNLTGISDSIKASLLRGNPVYICENVTGGGHVMVIDAFETYSDGITIFRFLNKDNYGTIWWRESDSTNFANTRYYISIPKSINVQRSNPFISDDPDNDGLMTFDEIHRFFTNPNYWDSDSDNVGDKMEIYSYTIREQSRLAGSFLETNTDLQELLPFIQPLSRELLADADGDSARAELDNDSDNDGVIDGEEDLNGNGKIDDGETDPHRYDLKYSYIYDDVPDNLVLYSRSYLRLNDGVKCLSKSGLAGSSVASELDTSIAIVVGVNTSVGEIYSKGQVWLRDNAKAGFIRYYGLPNSHYSTIIQGQAVTHREFNKDAYMWPWQVSLPPVILVADSTEVIVHSGESYTLYDGAKIKLLKIESGATLRLSTGEMTIGNLQLDVGSKVEFLYPGCKTVLRIKNDVLWNSDIENSTSMSTIASGFKLIYHGSNRLFIHGQWAGTLIAPNAKLILGQSSNKKLYGRFLGNGISVHQYSIIRMVPFAPKELLHTANNGGLL